MCQKMRQWAEVRVQMLLVALFGFHKKDSTIVSGCICPDCHSSLVNFCMATIHMCFGAGCTVLSMCSECTVSVL